MTKRSFRVFSFRISVLFVFISALTLSACSNFRTYTKEERSERLQNGEILAYLKNIEGTDLSIGEAQCIIDAPPARVWNAVTDYNRQAELGPRTRKIEITRLEGNTAWVDLILNSPWPMTDAEFTLKVDHDRKALRTNWNLVEGNIRDTYGSWEIDPLPGNPNRSIATYTLLYDDGSHLPRWVVNTFTVWGVRKIMVTLEDHVDDSVYDKPVYSLSVVDFGNGGQEAGITAMSPGRKKKTEFESKPMDEETLEILR